MKCSSSRIKNFLILWEMELCSSDIFSKNAFLIFSQKKGFVIFGEMKLSYISENGKNVVIFQEVTFRAQKVKRTHS